jgi:hypothetical protein
VTHLLHVAFQHVVDDGRPLLLIVRMPLRGEPAQPLARAYCVVVPVPTLPVVPAVPMALRRLAAALYCLCGSAYVKRQPAHTTPHHTDVRMHGRASHVERVPL